jgi:purine-cytosine permease-like protein
MSHYSKAIVAFLTGVVSIVAIWWPPVASVVSPEILTSVAAILTPLLVYLIPNKPAA